MVTFVQKLRQLVAGKEQPKPKAAASSGTRPDYFRTSKRDKATMARNAAIYESGGLVTAAIKAPGRTVLSNGWRLDGEEGAVKQVQAAIDALDFETLVSMLVDYAYVHGNGLAEIVPLRGGGLTVQLRDPARFRIEQDGYGNIVGYRFVQEDSWDDSHGPLLLPEEMVDLNLDPVPNSPYGRSLVSVCIDEILRDARTNEGLAAAVQRHGFPKYHVSVGQPGEQVAEADLKGLRKGFENLSSKNEFITGPDIAINTIDATGINNSSELDNVFSSRLCAALGVPPEQIGLDATGSTEATANVRFRAWYDRIAALQRVIATTLSRQLFDRITGRPGACWLIFEDPSPEDMAQKAEWISKIMAATPMDPFAVLPQDWIQQQFGIDPTGDG